MSAFIYIDVTDNFWLKKNLFEKTFVESQKAVAITLQVLICVFTLTIISLIYSLIVCFFFFSFLGVVDG